MADLLVEDLRTKLGANVTISAVQYPDGTSALKPLAYIFQKTIEAQAEQNAAAPAGEDVNLVTVASGPETSITREGVTHRVRPTTYQFTLYEKVEVTDALPLLA